MGRLDGKVALITGAGRGQGRAAALRMAAEGAAVCVTDIVAADVVETAGLVIQAGGRAVQVAGDITDPVVVDKAVGATVDAFGGIHVLHNNAGIALANTVEGYTSQDFDQLMNVNCRAQLLTTQKVLPHMRAAGEGSIINVSSVGGLVALANLSAYCASKHAVIGLTKGIAMEVAGDGIRCNAICPGGVDTPMAAAVLDSFDSRDEGLNLLVGRQLFRRLAEPGEIADLVVFLASDESSFMTGAAIPIEAGMVAW